MSGSTPVGTCCARGRFADAGADADASPPPTPRPLLAGFLYTPQQLAGSLRYGSGVLLGNWREDDALDDMRMMDYIESKETRSLALLKRQEKLRPQLAPVSLTAPPEDGIMRLGDVVLLQSMCNEGTLAASLGQRLTAADAIGMDDMYATFATTEKGAFARNAIKIGAYDGSPEAGSPVLYGQKITLEFSSLPGVRGFLSSQRSGRTQLSTQLIAKQEVYMQDVSGESAPYDCAWVIQPQDVDQRIVAQGTPVVAGAPFVITHCFTNKRLAGVHITMPSDFGTELGVCAHTYTETGKVNKLMRESMGRPTSSLISRNETTENLWSVLYA
jgi:hypothetical protein